MVGASRARNTPSSACSAPIPTTNHQPPTNPQITSAENPMFGSAQEEGAPGGVNPLWAAGGAAGLGDEDGSPLAPGAIQTREVRRRAGVAFTIGRWGEESVVRKRKFTSKQYRESGYQCHPDAEVSGWVGQWGGTV